MLQERQLLAVRSECERHRRRQRRAVAMLTYEKMASSVSQYLFIHDMRNIQNLSLHIYSSYTILENAYCIATGASTRSKMHGAVHIDFGVDSKYV